MAGDGLTAAIYDGWLDTDLGTVYVQLHTGDPGAAGTANISVGDTTRHQPVMAAASAGSKAMTGTAGPWTNGGTSETITSISLWSAATAGTFKGNITLTVPKAWASADTLTLNTLSAALTPVAS